MEIRKVLVLRGPNLWARFPVLEAWIDLKELKDSPSNELPGFNERLMAWLPGMIEHRCSPGRRGGFFERLREGTYQGHILEHVTLELQCMTGTAVGFGKTRETAEEGVYKVVIEYEDETVGRACLETAHRLLQAGVHDLPFDVEAEVARLRDVAHRSCLGPGTRAIVEAALKAGIPYHRLNTENLVVLGQGHRQRRILTAETDHTSAIAREIAQDKELTRTLLSAVGVPVPEGRPVASAAEAWEAARELNGPVVVKPRHGNQGRGTALNLITQEQVSAAFEQACRAGVGVLVERYAPGADHRLLVVAGKLVAAARREPPFVTGNGHDDIAALVLPLNADPLRGDGDGLTTPPQRVEIHPAWLAEQGYAIDSVPPAGVRVMLGTKIHGSYGGSAVDVTRSVHPDVAARVEDAARIVGLDVAGVDVVAVDISRPLEEQAGVVVKVNARPDLLMHLPPSSPPRPVGESIIASLFPEGEDGRIPVVGVSGVNGKTTVTRLIARILRGTGRTVGMTCTDGVFVNERRLEIGDCSGPQSARKVLLNPLVEAAVLETARGGILREGLAYDRANVSVITNLGEGDHLGLGDIMTLERLADVKSTLVDVVPPDGTAVLNAADPLVARMRKACKGSVFYFALDGTNPILVEHRAQGGRAAFLRDNAVVLAEGSHEEVLCHLSRVPLTRGGRIGFQVENVLAAVAAAQALGVPHDTTRAALEAFESNMELTPGRFNVVEVNQATAIFDYGHNPSALVALVEAIESFPSLTRSAVFTVAGDRSDEAITKQAALLGDAFDHVLIYESPDCRRGRAEGEILALLRLGLARGGRVKQVSEVDGEFAAIEAALVALRPGDLVLVQVDTVEAALEHSMTLIAALATSAPQPRSESDTEPN